MDDSLAEAAILRLVTAFVCVARVDVEMPGRNRERHGADDIAIVRTMPVGPRTFALAKEILRRGRSCPIGEATGGRTTRVGRPRGGMRVAARIGDRLRREIGRGRRPRVGDG